MIDPAEAPRHVLDAPDEWDCNDHSVEASVQPDGGLTALTARTVVKCQADTEQG